MMGYVRMNKAEAELWNAIRPAITITPIPDPRIVETTSIDFHALIKCIGLYYRRAGGKDWKGLLHRICNDSQD